VTAQNADSDGTRQDQQPKRAHSALTELGNHSCDDASSSLCGTATAWPLVVRAQQLLRRIGVLMARAESDPIYQGRIQVFRTRFILADATPLVEALRREIQNVPNPLRAEIDI
jgi:hypothetical protein